MSIQGAGFGPPFFVIPGMGDIEESQRVNESTRERGDTARLNREFGRADALVFLLRYFVGSLAR